MALPHRKVSYSIKSILLRYFGILFACTSVVLLLYCVSFVISYRNQVSYNTKTALDYYSAAFQTELKSFTAFQHNLCYSDSSFQLLTMKNLPDNERIVPRYNVTESLKRQISDYEAVFVFDEDYKSSTFAVGSAFASDAPQYVYQLKDHLREYWIGQERENFDRWTVFQDDRHTVLMNTIQVRDVYVCALIDLNHIRLLEYQDPDKSSLDFGFFDESRILSNKELLAAAGISFEELSGTPRNALFSDYYLITAPVEETEISLFGLVHLTYAARLTETLILFLIFMTVASCAVILWTFYSFHKVLLYPLQRINDAAEHLKQEGSASFSTGQHSNITEYENINQALANLIEQKISLTNEKQQEAFQKDHARLQYYQLQTNSHFYINCLKSLYNMLQRKNYEKMELMILAFSSHLRYIFHDNLHLVTLQSELAEVDDYYNIISLDRSTPFILNTQVDDSLLSYQVPSLILQTFLENTAKYNRESNNLLIFDIKIQKATLDGSSVMQIQVSDNGIGYDTETLERLNSDEHDLFAKKHVGISNLKHRIALIYKSNYRFAFYNKPGGGACGLIYLPLLEAPHIQDM